MDLKTDTSMCRRKIREIDVRIQRLEKKRNAAVERLLAERVDSYEAKVLFDEYRNIDQQIYQLNIECQEKVGKLREEKVYLPLPSFPEVCSAQLENGFHFPVRSPW